MTTIPTIGFNVETVQYRNLTFTVWDVGGQRSIRLLWRHYYENTQALIFVVDAADRARVPEARAELEYLLNEEELREALLLVFANKQDFEGAMSAREMIEALGLSSIRNRKWFLQPSCATTGQGVHEGMEWLASALESA